ncbi:protein SPMIP1-like [Ptychodera flava]|uniref:protein SPMIP1-like n=1 Tax=Ptychodera flava TaxID=63121 RepID=UPI003969F554
MSRGAMDTQRQNFFVESVQKEMQYRMRWKTKYSKEYARLFYQRDPEQEETTSTPKQVLARTTMPVSDPPRKSLGQRMKEGRLHDEQRGLRDTSEGKQNQAPLTEMRPVSKTTKSLLYSGFSKIEEGRHAYLQARKKKKPYEKFTYPMTNSWEYGWKIDDYMKHYRPPKHGMTHVVQDTFYRPNGVSLDESEFNQ